MQESSLFLAAPSYQLCLESPALPAGSPQSTLPALSAASAGRGEPSCKRTPTTLVRLQIRLAVHNWGQGPVQTQVGWA